MFSIVVLIILKTYFSVFYFPAPLLPTRSLYPLYLRGSPTSSRMLLGRRSCSFLAPRPLTLPVLLMLSSCTRAALTPPHKTVTFCEPSKMRKKQNMAHCRIGGVIGNQCNDSSFRPTVFELKLYHVLRRFQLRHSSTARSITYYCALQLFLFSLLDCCSTMLFPIPCTTERSI